MKGVLSALLLALVACDAPISYDGPTAGWPVYGGDAGGTRHSPLMQITPENVEDLEVAWTFHTGDVVDGSTTRGKSAFQDTPVLLDDTLYVCSPKDRVFALDPETGAQKWVFDPGLQTEGVWNFTCRGVAAWDDPGAREGQQCAQRIFLGTVDARLFALDAETGRACMAFGDEGMVDLTRGMGAINAGRIRHHLAAHVIGDVVAVGGLVWDGQRADHAPGVVRGFDARTGELRWFWDPVPPGTPPLPPSPRRRTRVPPRHTQRVVDLLRRPRARSADHPDRQRRAGLLRRRSARDSTTTRRPSSRCAARRANSSGTSRPCTTISGTTTSPRSRC